MSWFENMINFSLPYKWKCCDIFKHKEVNTVYKEINTVYFWLNLLGENSNEQTLKLLHQQNIHLNTLYDDVLSMGYDPRNEFQICAHLNIKSTKCSVVLNAERLRNLLQCISQFLIENHTVTTTCVQSVCITPIQNIFKVRVDGQSFNIDEETMCKMNRMKTQIELILLLLEREQKSYETELFKLLQHYCYKKSVKESKEYSKNQFYIDHFFEELIDFDCEIDKTFIREIATNFSEWFVKCIAIYIKTVMLDEKTRLQTFSSDWPYNKRFIDVKIMAKSGLYFTGSSDCVKCVFCGLILHDWNSNDNPILDHWKFSRRCIMLNSPQDTYNITDKDSLKELKKMLSILKTVQNFDEIDM